MDQAAFTRLLGELLNADNQIRSQAERVYNDAKQQNPDHFVTLLIQAACQNQDNNVRAFFCCRKMFRFFKNRFAR